MLRAVPFKYTWEGGMALISDPPPTNRKKTNQHKKYGFTPTTNKKIKKWHSLPVLIRTTFYIEEFILKLSLLHNCTKEESYFYLKSCFHMRSSSAVRGNITVQWKETYVVIGAFRILPLVAKQIGAFRVLLLVAKCYIGKSNHHCQASQ